MKKRTIFTAVILAICLFLSGCGGSKDDTSGQNGQSEQDVTSEGSSWNWNEEQTSEEDYDYEEQLYPDCKGSEENEAIASTGEFLIKNGKTEYTVVYAEDAGTYVLQAIEELNTFVSEATGGLTFTAKTDKGLTYNANAKYISIGKNKVFDGAGITVNGGLGSDGTQMVTKGNSVFLFGNTEKADLYAVYDFLYYTLDFDYMYKDVYSLCKGVKNVELKKYNLVNVPDIPMRAAGYGWMDADATMMNRMRMVGLYTPYLNINGAMLHNSFKYIDGKDAGHEGYWYALDKSQLCYTARGNNTEREALLNACLETLKAALKADLNAKVAGMMQEDHNSWCSCEACQAIENEYGTKSAILVLFMNDLRAKLDTWFATDEGKQYYRDMDIVFFSYHQTETAPSTKNTNGVYEANKSKKTGKAIHCNKGVGVLYAGIGADYTRSFYDERNASALNTIRGWCAVSDKLMVWYYTGPFANYMVWYNNFDSMQDNYRIAKECNAQYLFDQAQYGPCTVPFAWGALRSYLNSKLAWNVDADLQKLTDKFFKAAYGPAANKMKNYYFKQRAHLTYLTENTAYSCSRSASNGDIGSKEFWPKPVLEGWLEEINGIIDGLDELRRAYPELYTFYYNNIALERLSVYAQLVDEYSSTISSDLLTVYKTQFVADATALNIGLTSEQGSRSLTDIMREWGV